MRKGVTEVKKRHWQQDYETEVIENNKVLQGTERRGKELKIKPIITNT